MSSRSRHLLVSLAVLLLVGSAEASDVDPSSLRGKVMCGYQGWFQK